jgi:hypothetical protein
VGHGRWQVNMKVGDVGLGAGVSDTEKEQV